MNYDWETWKLFLEENWLVLLVALIVLMLVVRIVKTMLKWAIVLVIVVGVIIYSGYNLEELKGNFDDLRAIGSNVASNLKQEAWQAMAGEAANATYTDHGDGTFTVATNNLELQGAQGETKVTIEYRGVPLGSWEVDDTIRQLIEGAKRS